MVTQGEGRDTIRIEIHIHRSSVRRALMLCCSLVLFVGMGVAAAVPTASGEASTTTSAQGSNLERRLAAVEGRVTDNGKYSVGAKFCGTTANFSGNVGGYAAGKALCEPACGNSSTAHVCVTEEILRSVATSVAVPFGWYSSGTFNGQSGSTQHDCKAWTASDSGELGASYSQFGLFTSTCDTSQPILGCD